MKTRIFLTTAFFALCLIFASCADSLMDPANSLNNSDNTTPGGGDRSVLYWRYDKLTITSNGQAFLSDQIISSEMPAKISGVKVVFHAANNLKDSREYRPELTISKTKLTDPPFETSEVLYHQDNPDRLNGTYSMNFNLNESLISDGSMLKFEIALSNAEGTINTVDPQPVTFEISDIKVYVIPSN